MINHHKGIIALITVLIAGAIVLVVGVGMALRTLLESGSTLDAELSHQALVTAGSCMEQTLLSLADDSSYTGNETITIGEHTCTISAIAINGITRTIQTSSTVGAHTRRLQVIVSDVNPPLKVNSWQEVIN
jgi:hypothetical protein